MCRSKNMLSAILVLVLVSTGCVSSDDDTVYSKNHSMDSTNSTSASQIQQTMGINCRIQPKKRCLELYKQRLCEPLVPEAVFTFKDGKCSLLTEAPEGICTDLNPVNNAITFVYKVDESGTEIVRKFGISRQEIYEDGWTECGVVNNDACNACSRRR